MRSLKHPDKFSNMLLDWYHQHGRHDLPWQKRINAYRVWISEIMLQQTQVNTVIPYYERFMQRFPNLKILATAREDDVLAHWSGLGYYARARNLHHTAQIIHHNHNGRFPKTIETLSALPGIGRSTAGAILSFAFKQNTVILDGNVKRVLTRFFAIDAPTNQTSTIHALWKTAETLTPKQDAHHYNQAIMDLGATLCTRAQPQCGRCPLSENCEAYRQNDPTKYPTKIAKKTRPRKETSMLIIRDAHGNILLHKRPRTGIWGGLWSFPECEVAEKLTHWEINDTTVCLTQLHTLPSIAHQFTHFILDIHPICFLLTTPCALDPSQWIWYNLFTKPPGGIAAPVTKILASLSHATHPSLPKVRHPH